MTSVVIVEIVRNAGPVWPARVVDEVVKHEVRIPTILVELFESSRLTYHGIVLIPVKKVYCRLPSVWVQN